MEPVYVVYLCGCTDCFFHAAFVELEHAEKWAKENSCNPEGYLIKYQLLNEITEQ
jgi:hypothetical protein